jgi:hypothetical protein
MSIFLGFVALAIAVWAIHASIRIIRRIGFQRYSAAVGRLGWNLATISVAFVGIVVAAISRFLRSDDDGPVHTHNGIRGPAQMSFMDDDDDRLL